MNAPTTYRILTIDDNPSIHEDFRKLLAPTPAGSTEFAALESSVLGVRAKVARVEAFEVDAAHQGQEGLEKVQAALAAGRPYALAFVDVRMPPGWDGVETVERLWQADPELQIVICTAHSDHTWEEIGERLGESDSLLVLKKPFDPIEAVQIAHAMTRKWQLARQTQALLNDLDRKVREQTEVIQREVSARAQAEGALRQAQKMEAIGQLTAGIAHDFNNLLTVIHGYAGILAAELAKEGRCTNYIEQVAAAAVRAAALTSHLLAFSRKGAVRAKVLDLNAVLASAHKLLHRVIGENIDLRLTLSECPGQLMGDEATVVQVIMNLAINARDAMPEGGSLTLSSSLEFVDLEAAQRHPHARPGSYWALTVTDTGCGMDSGTLSKIFEPFFTTKEVGKGTGLGLATVLGIVQRQNGWVEVSSQLGEGSTFKVFLPTYEGPAIAGSKTEFIYRRPAAVKGKLTVLVVEDDEAIREFLSIVLTANSYQVIEATDGVNALEAWSKHAGKVDILLTDMVMPNGVNGHRLAEQLRGDCSWLKVIYSSGYGAEMIGAESLKDPSVVFLPKPYGAEALLRALAAVTMPAGSQLAA